MARKLEVEIVGDASKLNRTLQETNTGMKKMSRAAGAAGLALAGGLALGAKFAVTSASNLEEQINKTNVVFGKQGPVIQKWSKGLTKSFGLSQRAALEAAGTFGNMLVPMGVMPSKAAKMSRKMVELAGDMASFNNASPEETLQALQSGLAGETEPLRKFGVSLSQVRIEAEAVSSGLVKTEVDLGKLGIAQIAVRQASEDAAEALLKNGKASVEYKDAVAKVAYEEGKLQKIMDGKVPTLSAAEKAQATYNLMLKDTTTASGDFSETSGSLANQQRIVKAELENLAATLGAVLLPAVTKITAGLLRLLGQLQKHPAAAKALVVALGALAAALLTASAAQAALNLTVLANPYVAATVAIIAMTAAVAALYIKVKQLRPVIEQIALTFTGLPLPLRLAILAFGGLEKSAEKVNAVLQKIKGAVQWLIDKIPDVPSLPKPPGWLDPRNIGDARNPYFVPPGLQGPVGGLKPGILDELASARAMGLTLTSGVRPGAVTKHGTPSDHASGRAIDVAGSAGSMARFFRSLIGQSDVKQAFYDPLGSIFGGALSSYREGGHSDHVHVATYAKGGIFNKPTLGVIGEAGPEAVIPLARGLTRGWSGSRPLQVNLQLDGRTLASILVDPLRNEVRQLQRAGGTL